LMISSLPLFQPLAPPAGSVLETLQRIIGCAYASIEKRNQ